MDLLIGSNEFDFKAITKGEIIFRISVKDNYGVIKTIDKKVSFLDLDANFTVNATENTIGLGETTNIVTNVSLQNGLTANLSFTDSGSGTITYNGTTYSESELIPVENKAYTFVYAPSDIGNPHTLNFKLAPEGQTAIQKEIEIAVIQSEFDFDLNTPLDIYINELTTLNGSVTQVTGNDTNYEASFSIDTGSAEVYLGETNITLGTYNAISTGAFNYGIKGMVDGVVSGKIYIKNDTGLIKEKSFSFTVKQTDFTFSPNFASNSILLNETTATSITIDKLGV
jgi:hypothetical protein